MVMWLWKKLKYKIQEDNYYEKISGSSFNRSISGRNIKHRRFMQRMMTKPSQLQHLQHLTQRSLRRQNRFLRKKDMNLKLLYLMTM